MAKKQNSFWENFFVASTKNFKKKENLMHFASPLVGVFVVVLLLVFGITFWQKKQLQNKQDNVLQIPQDAQNVFVNDVSGVAPVTEKTTSIASENVFAKSEKYQIREISFGGNSELLSGETVSMPLEISDVSSEMLSSKNGAESNLLIRWKTNKIALSEVIYERNGISKNLAESGFGYAHALVLSQLEQSTRYTFSITAVDRWGNQKSSEKFSVFTGAKVASIIDLISGQFKQIFSWAIKN